ncbi:MAG: hypothetical protein BWY63_03510 [Chloroflexi bacterium ADurb.Bin360]|nr:MAG: hypothetical protein BWY63_03510 [Chloroflexi bacterium ADurb.Bin360]
MLRDDLPQLFSCHGLAHCRAGKLRVETERHTPVTRFPVQVHLRLKAIARRTLAAEESPFLACAAIREDAEAALPAIRAGANLHRAALILAVNRSRVGHVGAAGFARRTLATEESPFLACAAIREDAEAALPAIRASANLHGAALILAVNRSRVGCVGAAVFRRRAHVCGFQGWRLGCRGGSGPATSDSDYDEQKYPCNQCLFAAHVYPSLQ